MFVCISFKKIVGKDNNSQEKGNLFLLCCKMNPFLWLFVISTYYYSYNSCEIVFPIQVLSHSIGMKVRDSSSNCKSRTNDLVMVFVNDVVVVYGLHSRLIWMKKVQLWFTDFGLENSLIVMDRLPETQVSGFGSDMPWRNGF